MIKDIIHFFISKPILNHLLLVFLLIVSIFAYLDISKEIFPPAKLDAIVVSGSYAGSSADVLDKMAVEEIEQDLANLSGADKISSLVKNGFFSINIELKKGVSPKDVIDDVKDIVTNARSNLPSDMDEPTVKVMKHNFPLITVSVAGKRADEEMLKIAKEVKQKISYLKDLSDIVIYNESEKELYIELDEKKIDGFGLDKNQIINALSSISTIFPAGVVKDNSGHIYLSTKNGTTNPVELEKARLKINDKFIYLKDIAKVKFRLADTATISHFNGLPDMSIGVNKGETGDAIKLVKQIKSELKILEKKYPDIVFDTYTDTSVWVKNRLNTVVSNILFGLALLFIALLFFVNSRIAIVVGMGIPVSFMFGIIGAYYFGYSLNMLTLLGALIALGMLVDEAIVVGENIYRHLEMGKNNFDAAIDGSVEMFPSVVTATMTTIFAFLPILMMSGQTGKFMQMLPVMISILLFTSLLEAFIFLPLHAKDLYKLDKKSESSSIFWDRTKTLYELILKFVLKKPKISLFVFIVLTTLATYLMFINIKFQFMPNFDTTEVYIAGSAGVGKTVHQTEKMVAQLEQEIMKGVDFKKDVASVSSVVGFKLDGQYMPQNNEYYFQMFVNLHERAPDNIFDKYINPYLSPVYDEENLKRYKDASQIEKELKQIVDNFKGKNDFEEIKTFVPKAGIVKFDIEMSISGEDEKIKEAILVLENKLSKINGVINISNDIVLGDLEYKFAVNEYGSRLGFDEKTILNGLRPFFMQSEYAKMFDDNGVVKVKVQSSGKDNIINLETFRLNVPSSNQVVNLKDIATIEKKTAQSEIKKENGKKIVTLTAGVRNITSAEVYKELAPVLSELKNKVSIEIKGEEKENNQVKNEMTQAFMIALLLIFVCLVLMFDSLLKSLIVLSVIPFSIAGVLFGHLILDLNLTLSSLIGIVGLAGVVVNDGIIMMDFIQKATTKSQMIELALLRLRPILLTSITTILGLFTLMFFASGQALILQPVAVALGFGVAWATVLNLYLVPLLYNILKKLR